MAITRRLDLDHRARVALIGTMALLVALIATAFAIGGSGQSSKPAGSGVSILPARVSADDAPSLVGAPGLSPAGHAASVPAAVAAPEPDVAAAPTAAELSRQSAAGSSAVVSSGSGASTVSETTSSTSGSSIAATKIVKTGELTVRVARSSVQSVVGRLSTMATAQGGYVASSTSNLGAGEPSGEVVLRIPVAHFTDAIAEAERLGHVLSLTTSADDVTGHYVDLGAKEHALERTRATYLSILSKATTIGATLAVQERIQDVQEQIDSLHGQLKVLSSQASYSTLTVVVTPVGEVPVVHHARHGVSKAWHTSWSRFGRGIDAMVGAIGPLVLALLLLIAIGVVGTLGYRGVRRVTS
jgi:hypothetical protein